MDEKILGLIITLFLGLFIVLGAIISFSLKKQEKFIDFTIALAFSVILMLLFTDLMPEASLALGIEHIGYFLLFIILGIVILRIFDYFIPDHEEEKMTKKKQKENLAHIGFVSALALILHNIIEGMAIYSTCLNSLKSGFVVALGVGCHNIPLGMVITSTIYQNNQSKKKTFLVILGLLFSSFLGGLILFFLNKAVIDETFVGILLSITIGMLIYISSNELYPRLKTIKNKKVLTAGILTGILVIALTFLF